MERQRFTRYLSARFPEKGPSTLELIDVVLGAVPFVMRAIYAAMKDTIFVVQVEPKLTLFGCDDGL